MTDVDSICVVIGRTRHGMLLHEIAEAAKQGARLIEVRLDFLKKAPDFKRLLADKPCAMIATVRRPPDGGKWSGSEDQRKTLIRQAIVAGFDWVDLETDIADSIPRFGPVRRIISYHNFREMPADLEKIHARMCTQDADIVKVVVRATQPSDNLRILSLVKASAKPTIAFCMTDMGFPSRILQAKFGAPFTYAAFNKERNIAPGMPSVNELRKTFHYEAIDGDTEIFGVVGDPVGHSLSPLIHNMAFRKLGMNAVYLPFRVPRDTLADFLEAFEALPVRGYSVTIPHKEAAAAAATTRDSTVERTGAANTLVRGTKGFSAFNTDYGGVVQTLTDLLPTFVQAINDPVAFSPALLKANLDLPAGSLTAPPPTTGEAITDKPSAPAPVVEPATYSMSASLSGRVVLVLGAGGVARAAAHALHREGCLVTICNRTAERATNLVNEVGCRFVDWNARHSILCDLVINCTSVGMHPNVDVMPVHPSFLKPGLVVFDTVYTPEQTLLIKEARERNCHTITGVELFIRQASLQFQHFTGQAAPLDLFRKVIRKALSPISLGDDE